MHPHHPADAAVAIKGLPLRLAALRCGELQAQGLNVLRGDLPLPLAVLKRDALTHNIEWMQRYARAQGVDLAPHGKTTMSPELFRKQLDAGAWGITFANVFQLAVGVAAGVRRALIANQLLAAADLAELAALLKAQPQLRAVFLLDSMAQLALIEAWAGAQAKPPCFEVMLELGIAGGRTGVRGHDEALALARAARASAAVRLVGVECYEGLSASGDSARDTACADALMARLGALAQDCDREGLFEADEVLVSAGGSALFDLVAARLRVPLARPVRALLRSGCYITHDHGHYKRLVQQVLQRCACDEGLQPALEVWANVQSTPEPGLALLSAGRRDLSFDIELPLPVWHAPLGARCANAADPAWKISALNDQHAYLQLGHGAAVRVGDRIGLGISHPCTTFDKWRWMPVVDSAYDVVDAITIHF